MPTSPWAFAAVAGLLWVAAAGLSAASSTATTGAAPYLIDGWDTDDGLPQNSVTAIVQTRDGYLWFGTLNGLVRFDGLRFTVFDESNTPGLNSSRIVSLFVEDPSDHLWIGTETGGVARMKDGQVSSVGIGQGTSERRLTAACQEAEGAVWLYTADGQLWRYSGERFTPFVFGMERPSSCRTIIAERGGPVWVGTDDRLAAIGPAAVPGLLQPQVEQELTVGRLDLLLASSRGGYWRVADGRVQKWRGNRLERDLGSCPWNRPAVAACEDRQGNLVVGTLGAGLFWFNADGKATCLSTNQGLSHNYILALAMDRDGSLWVGTDGGGLNRVKQQVFEVADWSRSAAVNVVQSVCDDGQGGLWAGSNGGGVVRWKDGALERFGPAQGLLNSSVWTVLVDRQQRVWAGTRGGGLYQLQNERFQRVPGTETIPPEILAIHQDRADRLWLGTKGGLVRGDATAWRVLTVADGLSSDEVRALADDGEGGLWVGTVRGGLNHLRDGKFTAYHKTDGLPSEDVSSLHLDAEGVLWVGTFGSGLGRFQAGKWTRYTTREGLVSNGIGYLVEDGQGYLWLGSNAGLMRVEKRELNRFAAAPTTMVPCRAYGRPDGLPTRECTMGSQPGAARARDGRLWFPTVKGLASVHPSQLNPNPHPPPVLIESVLIDGQAQELPGERAGQPRSVFVPPGKEHLEIRYTSINLVAPDKGRFKYWLEHHESAWTEAGNTRVARFSRLPPGDYRFHVTACNEDGVWNDAGSVLAIRVGRPFWRTWWFLGATATGLLGGIVGGVSYLSTQKLKRQLQTLKQEEALERERARIARDIHDQLGASLTQVALLGELVEGDKHDPQEVEGHARQISQTARDTTRVLDEIVWAVNPSNDTLDGLMTYASKYAQEYLSVAGVRCRFDLPAELPASVIPPEVRHSVFLAFKEAVTNVVRHAAASAVWIRLRLEPGAFILEIEDNGRGLVGRDERAAESRNGLRNMRKRMEDLGGSFLLEAAPEGGARVRLTVPLGRP